MVSKDGERKNVGKCMSKGTILYLYGMNKYKELMYSGSILIDNILYWKIAKKISW